MSETETKNDTNKEKVVEKRVKPTVIRRRRVKAAPEKEKKEAEAVKAEAEKKASFEEISSEEVKKAEERAVEEKSKEKISAREAPREKEEQIKEKRSPLKIIAQPEELKDEDKEKKESKSPGVEKVVKKPVKRRKTRAELQFEDIKKTGGLKQYARSVISEQRNPHYQPSRVFEPGTRRRKKKPTKKSYKKTEITEPKAIKRIIKVGEGIRVSDLSQAMGVKASEIIKKLMELGAMSTVNQSIDADTAELIANEYGYEIERVGFNEKELLKTPEKKEKEEEVVGFPRPPVVTVMGHVDHGKTSILDIIREADVASGEAGGITQHIGAYAVKHNDKLISFVDTPGHEAFTHMRARGAQVTDIVILVVAADDGVMPQTREAIDHSKAAGVPIIVALNKIDKPNADSDKVKRELSDAGLIPEEWGGDTICVPTSAKTKEGIDQLLEMVLLQSEIQELKAVKDGRAEGIVIESKMDKKRGPVVTGIVKSGTLNRSDIIVSGSAWGNARALINDRGEQVESVPPSHPVEILGLSEVPEAGEKFTVVEDEKTAKLIAENRQKRFREEQLASKSKVTLEDLKSKIEMGEAKDLNLIVKTDVKGVADAVKDSLPGISTQEVKINVLHTGVGGITEGDVMLAAASGAVVLGFNVVPDPTARESAERNGVELKTYSVIYEMLEDVKKAVVGMLKPKEIENVLGRAEVREVFKVPKFGIVAGCMVTSGMMKRNARVRLLRDNVILHDGEIASLRRFKDDAKEVAAGLECGVGISNFNDLKPGDEIEAYLIEEIAPTWEEVEK